MTSLLLVRLSAMGDLVQSLGAVASLRAACPDARLTFVTQRTWAPLLDGFPGIARVVTFDRRGGLRGFLSTRRALRQERYDVALDLQGNWKSAGLAWASGARRRIGMDGAWRQEPSSGVLLTERVGCDATPHPARAAWELAKRVAPSAPYQLPVLSPTNEELAYERGELRSVGIDPDLPFRVIVGTDPQDPRALRPAWVSRLWEEPQTVVVTGPAEPSIGRGVARPLVRHAAGEVRRLVALGAAVAAAGGEVLGPDQGASHVLLAAGARGKVLFGSQDPRRTSPPTATAIQAPGELACRPCGQKVCSQRGSDQFACMDFGPSQGVGVDLGLPPLTIHRQP